MWGSCRGPVLKLSKTETHIRVWPQKATATIGKKLNAAVELLCKAWQPQKTTIVAPLPRQKSFMCLNSLSNENASFTEDFRFPD